MSLAAKLIGHQVNSQQVKKNLDFTAIILNQPCDWNQYSEEIVFTEKKIQKETDMENKCLLIFLMISVRLSLA